MIRTVIRTSCCVTALLGVLATQTAAQVSELRPVTDAILANPDPADWLMVNRTFDEQRFSPLNAINKTNVGQLRMARSRGLPNRTGEQNKRENCFIAAHDARTGKEVWKFYVTAAPGEPGGDTWADMPVEERAAGPWGLPGSYDPKSKVLYWGVANPNAYTRLTRHGRADAVSFSAPANLHSTSTLALVDATAKLHW